MVIKINIGSDNGLVSDGTKTLHDPMLTNHQWGPVAFNWGQSQDVLKISTPDINFEMISDCNCISRDLAS